MGRKRFAFQLALAVVVVGLIWIAAWGISSTAKLPAALADQAALLFGTASIALFLLSMIIAILAIFGWQSVKDIIRQHVEEATRAKLTDLELELRGRTISVLGHTLGLLSTQPDKLEPVDEERLREAVQICQEGYRLLSKVGGPAKFMALNNLVYYSCISRDDQRATYLLDQARTLKAAGQEHNATNLLLTYCRAVLYYGSEADLREASAIAAALLTKELSSSQRKEAKFYLASFNNTLSITLGAPGIQDASTVRKTHSDNLLIKRDQGTNPTGQVPIQQGEEPEGPQAQTQPPEAPARLAADQKQQTNSQEDTVDT